jgi:DNA-binding winged helix-turn-helix (wHTH) protein
MLWTRNGASCGAAIIAIEPQVFDLLVYLVHHRNRAVSRDDLIGSIWGGRIVSESALCSRINVRSAIGASGAEQRLIETLPRKGVRFVGEIREGRELPKLQKMARVTGLEPATSSVTGRKNCQILQTFIRTCHRKSFLTQEVNKQMTDSGIRIMGLCPNGLHESGASDQTAQRAIVPIRATDPCPILLFATGSMLLLRKSSQISSFA